MHLHQEDNEMKSIVSKLLPEQISTFWDVIRYAVEQSLPPVACDHPDIMNRILSSCLSGKTEVWAEYTKDGEGNNRFEGVFLTQFIYDDPSDTKNLLLYCLYGYEKIDPNSWGRSFTTIAKYAKEMKCAQIFAYTTIPYVIDLAKQLGGNTDYTLLSWNVNEIVELLNELDEV